MNTKNFNIILNESNKLFEAMLYTEKVTPFMKETINWLLKYKLPKKYATDKDFVCKLIVKYFESSNTINGVFEHGEIGYQEDEGDYGLAEADYYPLFIEAYDQNKSKI